jgi:nucleoside phosphorylase
MTNETTRNNLQRMRLSDARELIDWFAEEFGQNHLYFAQHAAFPLSLTPDLLYRLWINFQRNSSGEKLDIPWIAVADLLLSPLCKEVGHELYEMDMTVRTELLTALRNDNNLGTPRIQELSNFLLDYVRQHLSSEDSRTYKFAQAQHWTALTYIRPDQAIHELAQAIHNLREDKAERLRIASLIETLAEPLADLEGFAPLLVYARSIEHIIADHLPAHNAENHGMTMTSPSLNNLAHLLKLQRGQTYMAHNLLLASTISLTSNVIKQISPSSNWASFSSYLRKRETKHDDLINLLTKHIGIHNNVEGYRALAHLIKEGYFSTILTTNLDSTLEDLLLEAGLAPTAFQTLIVGYDTDEAIVRALDDSSGNIRIVKLHGSLRERVLPRQFPDVSRPSILLKRSLERVLNQDIIVVGSMNHDEDIMRMITTRQRSRLYYALPRQSSYDYITKLIEARGENLHTSLISGRSGEFTTFFRALEAILLPSILQPVRVAATHVAHSIVNKEILVADVLLVTATEVEARAVLDSCPENKLCFIGKRAYYDLGTIGDARTFMTQSEIGSDGLNGSRFTVDDGINALSPAAVIMVGIAFGLNEEEHHLGDILVSRQLLAYDNQRIGRSSDGKIVLRIRGDRVSAPTWLLDRFKTGLNTWLKPPYVHFGLLLSGSKLIANQDFRDQLRQIEGEAIGGEMEGVGLYEATQRHNVGWLLVKAICDWADNNKLQEKEKRQKEAAENAARFTVHVIQQGGFHNSKDTPKFKTVDDRL